MHFNPRTAKNKLFKLFQLITNNDILTVQETHGDSNALLRLAGRYNNTHTHYVNPHPNPTSGGTITFVKNNILGPNSTSTNHNLVPGRIQATTINNGNNSITVYNIHNYDITNDNINDIHNHLNTWQHKHKHNHANVALIMGDFNFSTAGESAHAVNQILNNTQASSITNNNDTRAAAHDTKEAKRWAKILGPLLEHLQHDPTRLGVRSTDDFTEVHISASRIDRIYSNIPPWLALQLRPSTTVPTPVTKIVAQ